MLGRGKWLRKAALLLALCAGAVGASAPEPASSGWKPDPDDQFLLDVHIRQLRLGDGVRAYNTPEGTCVVLGDFLTTLDVPMRMVCGEDDQGTLDVEVHAMGTAPACAPWSLAWSLSE